jgi:ribonuclease HI
VTVLTYTVFSDGACRGNGRVDGGQAGWAWHRIDPDGSRHEDSGGFDGGSNQKAEIIAATEALNAIPVGSVVTLISDSSYVINGMTEWLPRWKVNGWVGSKRKPVINRPLWELLDAAAQRHAAVSYFWTKGHAGHPENDRVDQLAVAATWRD